VVGDQVSEIPVRLDGALRSATISKRDVALADIK